MITRFSVLCDRCGSRGEEYGPLLTCGECGRSVNPCCVVNYDPEPGSPIVCRDCAEEKP